MFLIYNKCSGVYFCGFNFNGKDEWVGASDEDDENPFGKSVSFTLNSFLPLIFPNREKANDMSIYLYNNSIPPDKKVDLEIREIVESFACQKVYWKKCDE